MPLKPVYVIEGRRWLPLARAAKLLATNTAKIKRFMADGSLVWCQQSEGSLTLLVEEAGVLRLRAERGTAREEIRRRTMAPTKTARERGRAMGLTETEAKALNAASWAARPKFGVFDPTWDPSPYPLPISGRDPDKPGKP